jgi:hypothetical protein
LAATSDLQQGSIVWIANVPDLQGRNPKPQPRAFIVVSATSDIRPGNTIIGVAVTSTFREPVTDIAMVPMRWNARGTVETGFRRKCFAKVDWALPIPLRRGPSGVEFDGEFEGKFVRKQELGKIIAAVREVQSRDSAS